MSFIDTIPAAEAEGDVRSMYERQQASWGFVPSYAKVFSHRPEALARWGRLLAEIRRPMDDRLFELVTFAAAVELRHTPCSLEHGKQLAKFITEAGALAVARGDAGDYLTPAESAAANFARQVARDATTIEAQDVARLKEHGYTDAQVFDIAAAAAGRAFFTKLLDALGVLADPAGEDANEAFRQPLILGRPVAEGEPDRLVDEVTR